MFVSASPEHWCRIPELDNLTDLMTLEERKALSLPYIEKLDGKVKKYSKCKMYDVNYTAIVESWLEHALLENSTMEEGERRPRTRLPPPPVGNPEWPVTGCRDGWIYDKRDYDSTLVTEVNSTFTLLFHPFFPGESFRPALGGRATPETSVRGESGRGRLHNSPTR